MRDTPKVYDLNMNLVAYLENATTVGYEQPMNGLHMARFTLPADDPKNAECLPMRYVELYEETVEGQKQFEHHARKLSQ